MAIEKGDKVRVDISGTVGEYRPGLAATNQISETGGDSWTHFLYLTSDMITGNREPGGKVRAQFTGEVTAERGSEQFGTTQVRELLPEGGYGFSHYLFLNSANVTKLEKVTQSAGVTDPAAATRFAVGTKITVDMSVVIGPLASRMLSTNKVTQVDGGRWQHYLFLGSDKVFPKIPKTGDTVRAQFSAEVAGEFRGSEDFTTRVREIRPDGSRGYTHYLFLESDAVTVPSQQGDKFATAGTVTSDGITVTVVPDTAVAVADREITAEPVTTKAGTSTVSIDRYDTTISDNEVDSRIEDLESETGYDVVRVRNGEVLITYADEDDARQYITNEDYDPERVIVREGELDEDDQSELDGLRALRDTLGESVTYTLYNEDYFTEEWARDEARDTLGRSTDLDSWPLSGIDWDDACTERRDDRYPSEVEFDGKTFYYNED